MSDQIYWAVTPHRIYKDKYDAEVGDVAKTFDDEDDAWLWIRRIIAKTHSKFNEEYAEKFGE